MGSDDIDKKVRPLTGAVIEEELKRKGFLDPTLGICEHIYTRDPILAILETPELVVAINKPENPDEPEEKVILIDALLKAADAACSRAFGPKYDGFTLIRETMANLLASKDTHAKQLMFLCLLAIEPGLQTALKQQYPEDAKKHELLRVPLFIKLIKERMNFTFNTPFVANVPVPTMYNVDALLSSFLIDVACFYPY